MNAKDMEKDYGILQKDSEGGLKHNNLGKGKPNDTELGLRPKVTEKGGLRRRETEERNETQG